MTARNIMQLTADGETAETLRNALDTLNEIDPPTPAWVARINATRAELMSELQQIEGRLL